MSEEIFIISKNPIRAKALLDMAKERLEDIKKETKTYKIIEQYYEVAKEIIISLMYSNGFKTLSHKLLIEYLEKNYSKFFDREEFILIDELRRLRNGIVYYGKRIDSIFLRNKESQIKKVINKLLKVCRDNSRESS
ncbi:hypothetical protein BMS3Abin17_00899 [archaeon BMS3Abin17]|nr:hypothetical protein BMS3Abin17_00899 [archaeon BMS3Abin17]HDZ61382.1 hypothetical protein [Candidatus Pacearchaeota archaeon]